MPFANEDIIEHEVGNYWVLRVGTGQFRVYQSGVTHSTLVSSVTYRNDPERARWRAIAEANLRAQAAQ